MLVGSMGFAHAGEECCDDPNEELEYLTTYVGDSAPHKYTVTVIDEYGNTTTEERTCWATNETDEYIYRCTNCKQYTGHGCLEYVVRHSACGAPDEIEEVDEY